LKELFYLLVGQQLERIERKKGRENKVSKLGINQWGGQMKTGIKI
jgi:hypothetical protein